MELSASSTPRCGTLAAMWSQKTSSTPSSAARATSSRTSSTDPVSGIRPSPSGSAVTGPLTDDRGIGWQFQEDQLRFQITVEEPDLQGAANRPAREAIVEAKYVGFFDYAGIEAILGSDLKTKNYAPGKWL